MIPLLILIIFIAAFFSVFYLYVGYPLAVILIAKLKNAKPIVDEKYQPSVTILIAAYNEERFIRNKIVNSITLTYPTNKLEIMIVTDGSNDQTVPIVKECIKKYSDTNIKLLHDPARGGKIAAINRAMDLVTSDITIFTDANTELNHDAIMNIVKLYGDKNVGAISGEKRVRDSNEGFYWKYESKIKTAESNLSNVVGAAGELFSIRTELFEKQAGDVVLDDLMICLDVVKKGYKVKYAPDAYAIEDGSLNDVEEFKRKVRISAGGIQTAFRTKSLMNPFRSFGFMYLSHKIMRWFVSPFALIIMMLSAGALAFLMHPIWIWVWAGLMLSFTTLIFAKAFPKSKILKQGIISKLYYFMLTNLAIIFGWDRYLKGKQAAAWERAERK
jgi:cellulose synthase/poly-beta-1,6-N-acetylglucosamine synthase-like glycosyltransferase